MKKRLLFILSIIIGISGFSFAQTKTVTNMDLEKFRQKRLQAEQDYRENYERLGFPSPEELDRRREQDRQELSQLSERLTNERMQRDAMQREDEYRKAQLEIMRYNSGAYSNQGAIYGNGFYPFTNFGYSTYGFPGGVYYGNNYWTGGRVWRGGNYYYPVTPGTVFPPRGGVRINNRGVRISITPGGGRFPAPIRAPR